MKRHIFLLIAVMAAVCSQAQTPVPVVEEYTATWCGWCPQGIDGMNYAHEEYGDRVILIAIHKSDPMETSSYVEMTTNSYPSGKMNRDYDVAPVSGALRYYLNKELAKTPIAAIQLDAEWADADKTSILFSTQTTFTNSQSSGNYGIAFVLTEDGMTGTGSSWAQVNNLSGNADYETSYPDWYSLPARVSGLEFMHVAVAGWDVKNGVANSVSTPIVGGEAKYFNYTAAITSDNLNLIQDKTRLTAIAMLIDRSTGKIINAAHTPIADMGTGILSIENGELTIDSYYTIDGKLLNAPVKGVNIMKYSDGSVKKVVIK